jgi:hypothetical protein
MNDIEIRLSIIEPKLESAVIRILIEENLTCHGRYLDPREIPLSVRTKTILIISREAQHRNQVGSALAGFLAVLPIAGSELRSLPSLISDVYPKRITEESDSSLASSSLVRGIMPRAGASTLNEVVERNMGEKLFAIRKLNSEPPFHVLCSEIDDSSLGNLFEAIYQFDMNFTKLAVIINKLANNTKGRRKFGAVERELRALSVSFTLPIYFDGDIQVTGLPSKRTLKAVQSLFDWIADSK